MRISYLKYFLSLAILLFCSIAWAGDLDDLKNELSKATKDIERAKIYIKIADASKNDILEYEKYAKKSLSYSLKGKYKKGEAKAYIMMSYVDRSKGNINESEEYLNKSISICEEIKDDTLKSKSNILLAYIKSVQGKVKEAIDLQKSAITISKRFQDTLGLAYGYNMLASSYGRLGAFQEALKASLSGLKYAEAIKDTTHILTSYSNLQNIYAYKKNYQEAIQYGEKILSYLKHKTDVNSTNSKALCLENLGSIYLEQEQPEKAIVNFEQGIKLLKKYNLPAGLVQFELKIGEASRKLGKYNQAFTYLTSAKRTLESQGKVESLTFVNFELGLTQMKRKQYASALQYLDKSEKDSRSIQNIIRLKEVYLAKSNIYEKIGQTKRALSYARKNAALKDSVFNQDSERAMVEMKEKYDSEKKDLEIDVLKKQNVIDKQKSQRQQLLLFASLGLALLIGAIAFLKIRQNRLKQDLKIERFRVKVASDLHDDVGSTLSSISMYSEVLKQKLKDKDPDSTPMLESISDGSQDIMEALSDIVWTINPKNNSIKSLLKRIMLRTKDLCEAREIKFVYDEDEILDSNMDMDMAQNIYLSLKEAINNALKHSNCKELKLSIRQKNGRYEFELIDDGTGFDISKAIHGNGMNTMRERIEGFGGQFNINSSDKGTKLKFIFTL